MTWSKQPAWTGTVHVGCLNCSPMTHGNAPLCQLDRLLAVGFGDVQVLRDNDLLYSEVEFSRSLTEEDVDEEDEATDFPTLQQFEDLALADPDHDWRVHFLAPLHEEEYQRQAPGQWVLIKSGMGFA